MDKVPCAFTFKYVFKNLKITDKFVNLIKDKSKLKAKIISAVVGEKNPVIVGYDSYSVYLPFLKPCQHHQWMTHL